MTFLKPSKFKTSHFEKIKFKKTKSKKITFQKKQRSNVAFFVAKHLRSNVRELEGGNPHF